MKKELEKMNKLDLEIVKLFNENEISLIDGIRTILRIATTNMYNVGDELHEIQYIIMKLLYDEIQEIHARENETCEDCKNTTLGEQKL